MAAILVFFLCSTTLVNIFHQLFSQENNLNIEKWFGKRSLTTLSQGDPRLIQVIRKNYLNTPSRLPYNLTAGVDDPSYWQAQAVHGLLKNEKYVFFIECGAHDGEYLSNTLMLEKNFGWEGLLIEASPDAFKKLQTKNRRAWTIPACVSINDYPSEAMMKNVFYTQFGVPQYSFWKLTNGSIQEDIAGISFKVQCFPLYSMLLALNRTKVDYLSLDVEGNELNVLKTIPWDKVNITVLTAEFYHVDQGKDALREYMESVGYKVHIDGAVMAADQNIDFVFYHPDLLKETLANL